MSLLYRLKRIKQWLRRPVRAVKRWLGIKPRGEMLVMAYKGYCGSRLWLKGRVLRDRGIANTLHQSRWRALVDNYKRFGSKEVAGVNLKIGVQGSRYELKTDAEGYFTLSVDRESVIQSPPQSPWIEGEVLIRGVSERPHPKGWPIEILVPKPTAQYAVISDIDDTILRTDVTSLLKLRMLYLTFMKTAAGRQSFQKAGDFFSRLAKGTLNQADNPVFYVSNSPWNLYDLLEQFLALNNLPAGPILLRDFGLPYVKHPDGYLGHKHESILRIIRAYPNLPFILVGDSGEEDPYIYQKVAEAYPERIKAIYIRDVRSRRRAERLRRFVQETKADIFLMKTYDEAIAHAMGLGLVR